MVSYSTIWNNERRTGWEPGVRKEILSIGYTEIGEMGIMEHVSIGNGPLPAALNMKKSHVEITYSEGVSGEGAVAITQEILIGGSGASIKMQAIDGSNRISKEREKFGVVEDEIWYRVVNLGRSDVIRIEGGGGGV
jgi:hypothetical protein